MKVYRIKDWETHFENNRSKELKALTWVPMPNKHDGEGYSELVDHEHGEAHFGIWCALVQIASKCEPRGTLLRDGRTALRDSRTPVRDDRTRAASPHDANSLARKCRMKSQLIAEALLRILDIGWIEQVEWESELTTIPQDGAGFPHSGAARGRAEGKGREGTRTEGNGTEEKKSAAAPLFPPEMRTTEFDSAWTDWIQHRKEKRCAVTPTAMREQSRKLIALGPADAVAMLRHSIGQGYTGLFAPDQRKNENGRHKPASYSKPGRFHEDLPDLPEIQPNYSGDGGAGVSGNGTSPGAAENADTHAT